MYSLPAISLLDNPSAILLITSTSRGVSFTELSGIGSPARSANCEKRDTTIRRGQKDSLLKRNESSKKDIRTKL